MSRKSYKQQTPWFNRKDQFRMLIMVAALGTVLFAMKVASQPSFWDNFFNVLTGKQQPTTSNKVKSDETKKKIDFSVKLDSANPLPSDAFRSTKSSTEKKTDISGHGLSADQHSISSRVLKEIKDNTLGIRLEEANAFYTILEMIRNLSDDAIRQAATKDVPFNSLMIDADLHRGKIIHVEGQARRLLEFQAGENAGGIKTLYELWIFTPDSSNNPIRVVCTAVPPGIPTGDALPPFNISVSGYFFKREGYESKKGLRVAPLLLAKSPLWHPATVPVVQEKQNRLMQYIIGSAIVGILFVCLIVWRCRKGDAQFDKNFRDQKAEEAEADVAQLKDNVEYVSLAEMFQQLKEED